MRPSVSHYTQYKETVLFRATSTEIEASRSDRTDHRTERTDRRRRETTSECAPHDVNVTERMIEYAQRVCIASKSTSTDPYKKNRNCTHKYTRRKRVESPGDEREPEQSNANVRAINERGRARALTALDGIDGTQRTAPKAESQEKQT